ncbi:MAG: tRNA (adenosine(37)-N6)-dimethylallyltransferase MiaA [Chloroflexota bacterium]
MRQPLLVIVGPTAVGKTKVAVELALRLDGEVISADSMQVYRGMDIGTAKPTLAERRGIPHHLIDLVDPGTPFSVADFQRLAGAAVAAVAERGRLPMLVGGSGLYIESMTRAYELPDGETDWALRDALAAEAERDGDAALHARLAALDPVAAARIHPNDRRRTIRALEVTIRTGKPFSHASHRRREPEYDLLQFGLTAPRAVLYERIDRRVDAMIAAGLVDETRRLLAAGYGDALTARQAIGYKELLPFINGDASLADCVAALKQATRRYAKRQLTWFRRDDRIIWVEVGESIELEAVVEEICKSVEGFWHRGLK